MKFDPEKVERWTTPCLLKGDKGSNAINPVREYVIGYDYDALLSLYRTQAAAARTVYEELVSNGYHDEETVNLGVELGLREPD